MPADSVITDAAGWVEQALLGTLATSVAMLAITALAFTLLSGRLDTRRGAQILVGCFVVFSAGIIADGLVSLTHDDEVRVAPAAQAAQRPFDYVSPPAQIYDPYAGAAVPAAPPPAIR